MISKEQVLDFVSETIRPDSLQVRSVKAEREAVAFLGHDGYEAFLPSKKITVVIELEKQ